MLNPTEGTESGHTAIPAFIAKLWHMVSDSKEPLISWGYDGTTFIIKDHNKFSSELLPNYYKHNNMASFIRQLNMYNFHKVMMYSTFKNQKELEFSHPQFVKDRPDLLPKIQRKIHTKESNDVKCDPVVFNSLLKEVKQLRAIQEMFSSKLSVMKKENAALWREHSILRQRHAKQEKIVNKVIHFLISMVQQSSINVTRRKVPLMIKDRPILKPIHRKKYVKVIDPKNRPFISEVNAQEASKNTNQQLSQEALTEDLLLSCDESENEECEIPTSSKTVNIEATRNKTVTGTKLKQKSSKVAGKKRKFDETVSNEYVLGNLEANNSSSTSSFAESVPSPQYILVDSDDGISRLLQARKEEKSQDEAQNTLQVPELQGEGNYQLDNDIAQEVQNLEGKSPKYIFLTSPLPIVTSPAQSIPSPPSPVTVTANLPAGTSVDYMNEDAANNTLLQLAKPTDIHEVIKNKEDAEIHLDKVQLDLDMLKDLLKGEGISLDVNTVLELFNDNPIDLNMGPAGQSSDSQSYDNPSSDDQALISYTPSFLDLDTDLPDEIIDLNDDITSNFILNTPQIKTEMPSFPDPS